MILVFSRCATQALLLSLLLFISGCSWFGGDDDELIADSGEQQMYREAQRHLKNENFSLQPTGVGEPVPVWSIR